MTCVTCGVELPEGAARSAMSGQWLCAEHKVLTAHYSWSASAPEVAAEMARMAIELADMKQRLSSLWASIDDIDVSLNKHIFELSFWQRLRWLLLGR